MKINHYEAISLAPVQMEGAFGCQVRWLLGPQQGTPNFAMRQFEVAPGGFTPRHSHPYEHEVFVLEGVGMVIDGDRELPLREGDVIYVVPHEVHQFRNTGTAPLKFLCLVPNSAVGNAVSVPPECGR